MNRRLVVVLLAVVSIVGATTTAATAASKPSQVGLVSFTAAGLSTDKKVASLTIGWGKTKGASSYEVFRSTSYDGVKSAGVWRRTSKTTIQLTGLTPGKAYFVQVRGRNGSGVGKRSERVGHYTIRDQARGLTSANPSYKVMTYNICSRVCAEEGRPWSRRSASALGRITAWKPDVVALQEADKAPELDAGTWGDYTQALSKSGKRLLYRTDRFDKPAAGRTGYILLGNHGGGNRYAVWAELRDRDSGQRVIFTSIHLVVGSNATADAQRGTEVQTLVRDVAEINPEKLPVVYAGDFNSYLGRDRDSVGSRMAGAGYTTAYQLARALAYQHHNSYNDFQLTSKLSVKWGAHVDQVFVRSGSAEVVSWRQAERRVDYRHYASPLGSDHSPVLVTVRVR